MPFWFKGIGKIIAKLIERAFHSDTVLIPYLIEAINMSDIKKRFPILCFRVFEFSKNISSKMSFIGTQPDDGGNFFDRATVFICVKQFLVLFAGAAGEPVVLYTESSQSFVCCN